MPTSNNPFSLATVISIDSCIEPNENGPDNPMVKLNAARIHCPISINLIIQKWEPTSKKDICKAVNSQAKTCILQDSEMHIASQFHGGQIELWTNFESFEASPTQSEVNQILNPPYAKILNTRLKTDVYKYEDAPLSPLMSNTSICQREFIMYFKSIREDDNVKPAVQSAQIVDDSSAMVEYNEQRLADYADLLSNSIPDDDKALRNGRRDLGKNSYILKDCQYWNQDALKRNFLERCFEETSKPESRSSVLQSIETSKATIKSPERGPFSRYNMDEHGNIFATYKNSRAVQVYDLKGYIASRTTKKYRKSWNRLWVSEHDNWMDATARNHESPLGSLNKYEWLESRLFSLDMEILRTKQEVARREKKFFEKREVDIFGHSIKESVSGRNASHLDPEAQAFVPFGF